MQTLDIDRAYLMAPAVQWRRGLGLHLNCRAPQVANGERYDRTRFALDLERGVMTCPAGQTQPTQVGRVVKFEAPWLSFVHPDDLEATVAAGDTLQGGATLTHFSNRYRCRDGAYRRLEWQCVPSVPRQLIYGVVRLVPEPPAVPVSLPGGPGGSRTRVLIVDDQSAVALTMGRVLRHHDVTAVAHGPEALALLAAGRTFDVILSDLSSPVMPGPAFYAALVRHFPEAAARLAFVTGGAHTPEAQAFLSAAPHPCLEKPFHPEQLCALVEAVSQ